MYVGHRLDDGVLRRRRLRARVEVQHDFRVAIGLENAALRDQVRPEFRRVDQIPVVTQRNLAVHTIDENRLRIDDATVAGSGVADVPDRHIAAQ